MVRVTRLGLSQVLGEGSHSWTHVPHPSRLLSVAFFAFFDIAGRYVGDSPFARHGELVTVSASSWQKVRGAREILKPEVSGCLTSAHTLLAGT